jgi:hypothetical protein
VLIFKFVKFSACKRNKNNLREFPVRNHTDGNLFTEKTAIGKKKVA